MKILTTSLLAISLASCASVDNYPDSAFGNKEGYRAKIKKEITTNAKNPQSIKFKHISHAKKTFIQNTGISALWKPFYPVYGVCVEYGGTNSYGAYTESAENFYLKDGEIVYDSIAESNSGNGYDATTLKKYKPCYND